MAPPRTWDGKTLGCGRRFSVWGRSASVATSVFKTPTALLGPVIDDSSFDGNLPKLLDVEVVRGPADRVQGRRAGFVLVDRLGSLVQYPMYGRCYY
jgi:hypothetical protein